MKAVKPYEAVSLPLVVLTATMFLSGMPATMLSALACMTRPKEPSPVGKWPSVTTAGDKQLTLVWLHILWQATNNFPTPQEKPVSYPYSGEAISHSGLPEISVPSTLLVKMYSLLRGNSRGSRGLASSR